MQSLDVISMMTAQTICAKRIVSLSEFNKEGKKLLHVVPNYRALSTNSVVLSDNITGGHALN